MVEDPNAILQCPMDMLDSPSMIPVEKYPEKQFT